MDPISTPVSPNRAASIDRPLLGFLRDVSVDPKLANVAQFDLDAATEGRGMTLEHFDALRSGDRVRVADEIRKEAEIAAPALSSTAYSEVQVFGAKLRLDDIKL